MTRVQRGVRVLVGASFSAIAMIAAGTPQVVGDEACERYAVDIAAFATCDDGRVVLPAPDPREPRVASRAAAVRYPSPFAVESESPVSALIAVVLLPSQGAPPRPAASDAGCNQGPDALAIGPGFR